MNALLKMGTKAKGRCFRISRDGVPTSGAISGLLDERGLFSLASHGLARCGRDLDPGPQGLHFENSMRGSGVPLVPFNYAASLI